MLHEFHHGKASPSDDHHHSDDVSFDIDYHASSNQAYATNFCPNSSSTKVCMPSNKWFSLSDSNKAIWDRLDDQAKGIFLDYVPPTNTNTSSRPSLHKPPVYRPFTGKIRICKSFFWYTIIPP
jgi:hypothetical protein